MMADDPLPELLTVIPAGASGTAAPNDERLRLANDVVDTVEVIPVVQERILVSKRAFESERVRVRLVTDEVAELARVSLRSERIEVERVPVGREVERAPDVREEHGVTIIPVLEEVVVVEKRLVLKEELHVRRVADTREEVQAVTLRRQRAEVERLPPPTEGGLPGATPYNPGQNKS